jgi:endonuclease/exonuclease/phosphatase family metal-dependent hydrolase
MIKRIIILFILLIAFDCGICQSIKVMSYNIRFDNPHDSANAWPNRKNKVFELLKKYNPDIIGVQEALLHQIDDILKALPEYSYIGSGRDDGKSKGEYSAILFNRNRFRVSDVQTSWLSESPDIPGSKSWDAAITRIITSGKFTEKKSGQSFYILNTHFDHVGKEARKQSAGIIKEKARKLKSAPVIITGDLNCTRNEDPYQVLMMNDGIQLIDPAPSNPPGTFCSFVVNSIECRPIDYIFHSSHWTSSHYQAITDNDGKYYPSDHLPVMIDLLMK